MSVYMDESDFRLFFFFIFAWPVFVRSLHEICSRNVLSKQNVKRRRRCSSVLFLIVHRRFLLQVSAGRALVVWTHHTYFVSVFLQALREHVFES